MWPLQLTELDAPSGQRKAFAAWGWMKGNKSGGDDDRLKSCGENSPSPPWAWDNETDGPVHRGELALDPVHVAERYFSGSAFGGRYKTNRYLQDLANAGYSDANLPDGWSSNFKLSPAVTRLGAKCSGGVLSK